MMTPETNPCSGQPPPIRPKALLCWNWAAIARLAAACQGKARAMPTIAAKLSWKEMRAIKRGSRAVINTALKAKAGSKVARGRPSAKAPR